MTQQLQQQILNESAQLSLEKYNIEKRLVQIDKRMEELSIVNSTLITVEKENKQKEDKSTQ